jgi:hypothetical protein
MRRIKEDPDREERIEMEIIADAHDSEERALGWCYYLDEALKIPFDAQVIAIRPTSPLVLDGKVEVLGMAPEDVCIHEMFVWIRWNTKRLAVPLAQLQPLSDDAQTLQAVSDWHYWLKRGYEL